MNLTRFDLKVIASWIEPESRVLDLGCGQGDLMKYLTKMKRARCQGIEQDEKKAAKCIEKGLFVLQGDINTELPDYPLNSFDYVVLSQTLQQVYNPGKLIKDMLFAGKKGIVSFPNFSHWKVRKSLLLSGCAPKTEELPFDWHNTPNIRVITINDFRRFSREVGFKILKEACLKTEHHETGGRIVSFFPNLRSTYGIFLITGD